MDGRSGRRLVLAVGCGPVAMSGARPFAAREKAPVETRDVPVAARDIDGEVRRGSGPAGRVRRGAGPPALAASRP